MPAYRRQRLETPDGDFLDLDWVEGQNPTQPAPVPHTSGTSQRQHGAPTHSPNEPPLVVLFHGLEGSSASHYARALMQAVAVQGWQGVVVHFRGCSGEPNRLPRAYHSGDSAEIGWVLQQLRSTHRQTFAVGVSLGGNALLKWLGEAGASAGEYVSSAVAVSVPYDLAAADTALSSGMGLLYARHFLRSLIPHTLAKAQRFPGHVGLNRLDAIRTARTLRQFDDAVTAPLHGFANAADYYARSSSGQYLSAIAVPTLLLHAHNDPFLPVAAIPDSSRLPSSVQLEVSNQGGHVGFVSGSLPGHLDWLPQRLFSHFSQYVCHHQMA